MLKTIQNISYKEFAASARRQNQMPALQVKKIAGLALGLFFGGVSNSFYPGKGSYAAFAKSSHEDASVASHVIQEIVDHAIWHHVGHVVGLTSFAAGLLGGLLSFQSLGEKEGVYIPKRISPPLVITYVDPTTKKTETALKLANGKELRGREIIDFYQGLRFIKILEKS